MVGASAPAVRRPASLSTSRPTPFPSQEWRAELAGAMQRVSRMRTLLREALEARGTPGDWSHVTSQVRGRGVG